MNDVVKVKRTKGEKSWVSRTTKQIYYAQYSMWSEIGIASDTGLLEWLPTEFTVDKRSASLEENGGKETMSDDEWPWKNVVTTYNPRDLWVDKHWRSHNLAYFSLQSSTALPQYTTASSHWLMLALRCSRLLLHPGAAWSLTSSSAHHRSFSIGTDYSVTRQSEIR